MTPLFLKIKLFFLSVSPIQGILLKSELQKMKNRFLETCFLFSFEIWLEVQS